MIQLLIYLNLKYFPFLEAYVRASWLIINSFLSTWLHAFRSKLSDGSYGVNKHD